MEADLGVGFLLFHGTRQLGLLSLRFGLGLCRGYSVRRCPFDAPIGVQSNLFFHISPTHFGVKNPVFCSYQLD